MKRAATRDRICAMSRGSSAVTLFVLVMAQATLASNVAHAASLIVGNATGNPGQQVTVSVAIESAETSVVGTQNDINFGPPLAIAAKANGKPDCTVNPDIDKGATSFAFRPNGCVGAACTSIRALVIATDNVTPIASGSVLYTCKVNIGASATNGQYPLTISGIILSDPNGDIVPNATGTNGTVVVGNGALPTHTPTSPDGRLPTPTPTLAQPQCTPPAVQLSDVDAPIGVTTVNVSATLLLAGQQVAGLQNDITFSAPLAVATKANAKPDCSVNPAIGKGASSFAFRPNGCTGAGCTSVRTLVLATDNVDPIPSGVNAALS
jgi:hypothetical protein